MHFIRHEAGRYGAVTGPKNRRRYVIERTTTGWRLSLFVQGDRSHLPRIMHNGIATMKEADLIAHSWERDAQRERAAPETR